MSKNAAGDHKKFTLPMRRVIMRKLPSIMKPGGTKQRQQAYFARSHLIHARGDAEEAMKARVEEHGRSSRGICALGPKQGAKSGSRQQREGGRAVGAPRVTWHCHRGWGRGQGIDTYLVIRNCLQ